MVTTNTRAGFTASRTAAILVSVSAVILFTLTGSARLHAQTVTDFTVNDFTADYTLTRNDPQGQLHIIENIDVNFSAFNHGILRAIPDTYKKHKLQLHVNGITSASGAPTGYTTYGQNGNTVLKIGDPHSTVTGKQQYKLDYTLNNVIGFEGGHDELYWDINGDQWDQLFEKVSLTLHVPADTKLFDQGPLCFTGAVGSTDKNCTLEQNGQTLSFKATKALQPRQTMTVVVGFEKGYFTPSKVNDTLGEYTRQIVGFIIPVVLFGGYAIRKWLKYGRDAKGRGVIVPQYQPPDGLSPLKIGTIIDFKADNRDITATFIDLAIRGYIKIHEEKKNKLIGKDVLKYSFELRKTDWSDLDTYESDLMRKVFPDIQEGQIITMESLKNSFYTTAASLRSKVSKDLTAEGYFVRNPALAGGGLFLLAGILFLSLFILTGAFGAGFAVGVAISILLCVLFGALMASRTAKGVIAKEHILGLKLYLKTAEADRIRMLQSPDAPYATNHSAPTKTVELFEKLLPYAIVLGVEADWAKQFQNIYTQAPDWYAGNWSTFNTMYLASSLGNSFVGGMNSTAFTAPSSSGSSGFGGGGFSGGGGGGGGGGGW